MNNYDFEQLHNQGAVCFGYNNYGRYDFFQLNGRPFHPNRFLEKNLIQFMMRLILNANFKNNYCNYSISFYIFFVFFLRIIVSQVET